MGGTVYPLVLLALLVLAPPALAQDIMMVPVTVDGETVQLAMRIYKPTASGPAPTLVFNHGSTGRGNDPSIFVRSLDFPPLAQFFVQRGWAVVIPARGGRGGSEGQYDEGFATDRSAGYSCEPELPGRHELRRNRLPALFCPPPRFRRER